MKAYARIRPLTESNPEDIDQTFRRLAELLRDTGRTASLRCTILIDDGRTSWTFELQGRESCLSSNGAGVPDVEIITREATWWEIAGGRLSPLDAFLQGRMRFLGDTELGACLLRHLADGGGVTSICGE
jgi:hypothetical protein